MPTEPEIRRQLERILTSPLFSNKPKRQDLLKYFAECAIANAPTTQKDVATALKKEPGAVRALATELRDALEEYYRSVGQSDPVVVTVGLGQGYPVTFEYRSELPPILRTKTTRPALQDQGTSRQTIHVRADPKDMAAVFLNAHHLIEKAPAGSTIIFDFGRTSSVLLYLRCTDAAYDWLISLWRQGGLERALGFPIESIRTAEEVEGELLASGSNVLESCFSPIIDFNDNPAPTLLPGTPEFLETPPRFIDLSVRLRTDMGVSVYDMYPMTMLQVEMFVSSDALVWRRALMFSKSVYDIYSPLEHFTLNLSNDFISPQQSRFVRAVFRVIHYGTDEDGSPLTENAEPLFPLALIMTTREYRLLPGEVSYYCPHFMLGIHA